MYLTVITHIVFVFLGGGGGACLGLELGLLFLWLRGFEGYGASFWLGFLALSRFLNPEP